MPTAYKVLLIGPVYSNPAAAEVGILNALMSLGYTVNTIDPRQPPGLSVARLKQEAADFCPDFILAPGCTPYADIVRECRETVKTPFICWNAEEIRLPEYAKKLSGGAPAYDFIFHFDESALPLYKQMGIDNVSWLPLGFDSSRYFPEGNPGSLKAAVFVGSLGGKHENRRWLISQLGKAGIPCYVFNTYDLAEIRRIYTAARVVLNIALGCEPYTPEDLAGYGVQQRIYEAAGCNAVICTNGIHGWPSYNDCLPPVEFYSGAYKPIHINGDFIEVIRHKIERSDEEDLRDRSIMNACKINHTYAARLTKMIEVLVERGLIGA